MKKIWLLATLLIAWLLLTGCNKTVVENPEIIDDYEVPDDFDWCNNYFDGCNRCALQDDWEIVCTKKACLEYAEAYCADDESLENIDQFQESDLTEWWWERITVVTDMCKEQWWEVDNKDWSEICFFWDDNRCNLDELADWSCRNENL